MTRVSVVVNIRLVLDTDEQVEDTRRAFRIARRSVGDCISDLYREDSGDFLRFAQLRDCRNIIGIIADRFEDAVREAR